MFNNKKGDMFWIIIFASLALVVGAIILLFAKPAIEKGFGVADTQLGALDDFDDDKIANFFDDCPCLPPGTIEDPSRQGCPRGTTAEQSQENKKLFKEKKCPEMVLPAGEAEAQASTLELFDGVTKIPLSSTYKTTSNSLTYRGTCATRCEINVRLPNTQELDEELSKEGIVDLSLPGRYFIILTEQRQEKIRYQVEKQE